MALRNESDASSQFIPEEGIQGRRRDIELNLGEGYEPGRGNKPSESVFNRILPNAVTAKSDELFTLARKSSLWTLSFGLACCAIEMISTHMSHHDLDRFGVVTWPSPRQADVMIVAGTVVKKMAEPIKLLYEQMPDPKWVIAMGSCATNGGPYYKSYSVVMGVDHLIPVDVYIPGCPPRPEALMHGIMQLQEKIHRDARNPVPKTLSDDLDSLINTDKFVQDRASDK